MKDIYKIKYLYEHAPATILLLISSGFILSLSYNFSYFLHIDKLEYLTLLGSSDYIESSLSFIVLIIIALFYAQIVHVDPEGIIGRFRRAQQSQKEIKQEIYNIPRKFIKQALFVFMSLLNTLITSIQILGVCLPYLLASYFAFDAYLKIIQAPYYDIDVFFRTAVTIPLLLFSCDFVICILSTQYKVRAYILKVSLIAVSMSYALGAYTASNNVTESIYISTNKEHFLRAINKGAFLLDTKNELIFKTWDNINYIEN